MEFFCLFVTKFFSFALIFTGSICFPFKIVDVAYSDRIKEFRMKNNEVKHNWKEDWDFRGMKDVDYHNGKMEIEYNKMEKYIRR